MTDSQLSVAIELGGTFTDVMLQDTASGRAWRAKIPFVPADPSQAFITGVRPALAVPLPHHLAQCCEAGSCR